MNRNERIENLEIRLATLNNMVVVIMKCFEKLVNKNMITPKEFEDAFTEARIEMQPVIDKKSFERGTIQSEATGNDESGSRNSDS